MAHSLSAKKRNRQNIKQRMLNRQRKSTLKSTLRTCRDKFQHGSVEEAQAACRTAFKLLDREANRGTLHRNAAARRKSRMARRLNEMKARAGA